MVAAAYRQIGRIDDAISVLRAEFVREPGADAYRTLLDFAAAVDRADIERGWALDHGQEIAVGFRAGSVLVQIALSEDDVDAAWDAADRYGAGWVWKNSSPEARRRGWSPPRICTGRVSRRTCCIPSPS